MVEFSLPLVWREVRLGGRWGWGFAVGQNLPHAPVRRASCSNPSSTPKEDHLTRCDRLGFEGLYSHLSGSSFYTRAAS